MKMQFKKSAKNKEIIAMTIRLLELSKKMNGQLHLFYIANLLLVIFAMLHHRAQSK